jgi:hypothetical protein
MYLPLQSSAAAAQNQITARRAVREAEKRLEAFVMSEPQRRRFGDLLLAVESVVGAQAHTGGSLAALLDPAHLCIVPLAERCPARVGVGHCYALRPLLRAMARDSKYRALAVSARQVTLFEGDGRGLARAPASEHLQGLCEEQVGGSRSPARGDLARFYHRIGRAMARRFARRSLPLVLIADVQDQAGLRGEFRLPGLLPEGVTLNPDDLSAAVIHARAWPLIEAWLLGLEREALASYERARRMGKAVDLLDDVAAAVAAGRVRRLWLDAELAVSGRVDPVSGRIVAADGEDDVLDALAELALARAGEVRVVDAATLPSCTGVAAELH